MANKNSSNFDLDLSQGGYKVVASANQATQNFQGMDNYVSGVCFNATASTTIANMTTETSLIPVGLGSATVPVNFLEVGKSIKVIAWGTMATTSAPTLRLRLKVGSTSVSDSTAVSLATISGTVMWRYEGVIDCRTIGATGTVFSQGVFTYYHNGSALAIATPTTSTVTIDTTATQTVGLTVQWGTASASNTITCTNFKINLEV